MTPTRRSRLASSWQVLAAVLVTVVVAIAVITVALTSGEDGKPKVEVVFGQPLGPAGQKAYAQVRREALDDDSLGHANLADEAPPGSAIYSDPELRAKSILDAQAAAEQGTTGPNEIEDPRTLAEPEQQGCRSGPWVGNFSSRNGARPSLLVAHLTVSHNVPGRADVSAIDAWFANPRSQASSNYVIDAEGNCDYIVNEAYKAWTQGFFNPWSISIEFVHYSPFDANEPWPDAQIRKGARVFADASKRWGIPIRLVDPSGCSVVAGVTDHDRLECGNEHTDVGRFFPWRKLLREMRGFANVLPACSVENVKRRLNSKPPRVVAPWSPPSKRLTVSSRYSGRAGRVLARFKLAHDLRRDSVVSKSAGKRLRLAGCDGSIR